MNDIFDKTFYAVFDVEQLAPIGFQLMMESAYGPHHLLVDQRISEFTPIMKDEYSKSISDFKTPAVKSIPLSKMPIEFNDSLSDAIFRRKSVDKFEPKNTSFDVLSFLLKMSAGIRPHTKVNPTLRYYPSGGGLHTLRIYIDVKNVDNLEPGLYLFNPLNETLDLINDDYSSEDRNKVHCDFFDSDSIKEYSFEILISTKPSIALKKYGEHGWKLILMEAGHLAQNLLLVGTGCGLVFRPWSAFEMNAMRKSLRTHHQFEFLLYSLLAGSTSKLRQLT